MTVRASELRHPVVCCGRHGFVSVRGGARRCVLSSSLVALDASCMCERAELHEVAVTRESVCNTVVPKDLRNLRADHSVAGVKGTLSFYDRGTPRAGSTPAGRLSLGFYHFSQNFEFRSWKFFYI